MVPGQVTILLNKWSTGDDQALNELIPIVYSHLKNIAGNVLRGERPGHVLQPTALVNEAYLRLAECEPTVFQGRNHFFAVAGRIMRNILVDYARRLRRKKRGGDGQFVPIDTGVIAVASTPEQILMFDDALDRLSREYPRKGRLVELHCFGGLSLIESAKFLGVSENTAQRDWNFAKTWLMREFERQHERRA